MVKVPEKLAKDMRISAIKQERHLKDICAEAFEAYLARVPDRSPPA